MYLVRFCLEACILAVENNPVRLNIMENCDSIRTNRTNADGCAQANSVSLLQMQKYIAAVGQK